MKSQRGDIYSCGKFEYTGHGSNTDILIPLLLDSFGQTPIKQISGYFQDYNSFFFNNI